MKRKKIKSLLAAFMIFVTVLFVNVSVTASENDELPDPTDEDIWFQHYPGESQSHDYNYYYVDDLGLHSFVDGHDLSEEEEAEWPWPVDSDNLFDGPPTYTEIFNSIQAAGQVVNVKSSHEAPENTRNMVEISLSLFGVFQIREPNIDEDQTSLPDPDSFHWGTREVMLSAEMIDGPDDSNVHLYMVPDWGYRSSRLKETEVEEEDDMYKEMALHTVKFGGREAVKNIAAAKFGPKGYAAVTSAEWGYGMWEIWEKYHGGVQEDEKYSGSGSGLNDPVSIPFYYDYLNYPVSNSIEDWEKDTYEGGKKPVPYSASVRLLWNFNNEIFADMDYATLRISAKNLIGVKGFGHYDDVEYMTDGAESYVDITIKNARLDAETDEDAFSVSTPTGKLYTSQFTPTGEFERVYPSISFDLVDNIIKDGTPEYRVKIYTVSTISTDDERLHHTFTSVGANSSWDDVTMETYFKWDDWKNLDDGLDNGDNEVRISITRVVVEAWSEYGGWTYVQEFDPDDHSDGMYWDMVNDIEMAIKVTALERNAYVESYGEHTYQYRIDNKADVTGEFVLEVTSSDPDWAVSVHPEAFLLAGDSNRHVDVTVNIPDGVQDGASTNVTLTATASKYIGVIGCPYVSSWNGTDYQLDNNILIASEHQDGMVDDHYVLQNVVEPKDGYYSLKIEEFENSKDHFDTVKLYTIDHQEGYEIATTPDGEIIAYREPRPAVSAYNSEGEDVLEYLNNTGGEALFVEEGSSVILNFGELSKSQWEHNKLVVQSHGFESYTDVPPDDSDPEYVPPVDKYSLHVGLRMDGSEWKNVTILHPRNHPSAIVIPLNETLEGFVENKSGGSLGELEVKILGTDDHYIDFVGIDDSVPAEPTKVQKTSLVEAILNGETDVTDLLSTNDTEMVTLIPGEHISLDFDIPEQSPAPVFGERSYMLYSKGYYELFMGENEVENTILSSSGELLSQTVTAYDNMTVTYVMPSEPVFELGDDWSVSPISIKPGESVTIAGTVENTGNDIGDEYVDILINDILVYEEHITSLGPGEDIWVSFTHTEDTEGSYDVKVQLRQYEDHWESSFTVEISPGIFVLHGWSVDPTVVFFDETVTISGWVYNDGDGTDSDYVELLIDNNLEESTEITLEPGEGTKITFTHSEGSVGIYDVTVRLQENSDVFWESSFEVKIKTSPAEFVLEEWSVEPDIIEPGEYVYISGHVTNIGDEAGGDYVDLYVNNDREEFGPYVSLNPGDSEYVYFWYSEDTEGTHSVRVQFRNNFDDYWENEFTVEIPPAEFNLVDWSVSPSEVEPGETVTISGQVENIGGETDSDTVDLYVGVDNLVDWADITIGPYGNVDVSFTHTEYDPGDYSVGIKLLKHSDAWWSSFTVLGDDNGDDDDNGGNGGGGCPYVSTWNGTEYQLDNNILIASEHQGGIVDDHYILQNTVEPKDGYYSLRIEEFENSKDYFDMVEMYTIDHQEGYEIAMTPDGEIIAYRDPKPALSAYNSDDEDVLEYISTKDGKPLLLEGGSSVTLNFGEITKNQWEHTKLIVQSHGFESYTDVGQKDPDPILQQELIKSLYVAYLRVDGSEWKNITVLHPRNNPSVMVVPLDEALQEFFPGMEGDNLGHLEIKILSTKDHYIDFVGLDDSVPEPLKVQEATLVSAILNGETDVTDILQGGNEELVSIIPGEHIILTFEIPKQSPAPVFSERSFMLFTRGYYELYDEEIIDEKSSPDDAKLVVKDQHNFHAYEKPIDPPSSYLDVHLKGYGNELYVQVPIELRRYLLDSQSIRSTME